MLRKFAVVCGLTMLASVLSTAPASAGPQWTLPGVLGAHASDVEMGVNSAGDAVAVWANNQEVKASYRPAGQDWQHPVGIGDGAQQVIGAFVDDDGRATALWWQNEVATVADRGVDGRWTVDPNSPATSDCCSNSIPIVRADSYGQLAFTWESLNDMSGGSDNFAWRTSSGTWSEVTYGGGGNLAMVTPKPGMAVMAKGSAGLYTQAADIGQTAGPWKQIWPAIEADDPVLAVNDRGDMVLAAVDGEQAGQPLNGAPGHLIVISKPAGEGWRETFATDTAGKVSAPAVAISDGGRIVVTYQQASDSSLVARVGDAVGGSVGVPSTLSTTPQLGPASVVFNRGGDALAAWTGTGSTGASLYAASLPTSGQWSTPAWLGQSRRPPKVYTYPSGMFTVLYIYNGRAKWRDFVDDHTGPTTHMLAPRRDFVTSPRFRVRWTAEDALSRPRYTDVMVRRSRRRSDKFGAWKFWKRADGTVRSGVFKAYLSGTFCFKARSWDRAGNLGRWSTQRCTNVPRDDSNVEISGDWHRVQRPGAYRDTLTVSRKVGARLRMTRVHARSLKLLVRTSRTGGAIRVQYAGHDFGVFQLTSRHTRDRVLTLGHFRRRKSGTVGIQVVRHGPVRIDGLAAIR